MRKRPLLPSRAPASNDLKPIAWDDAAQWQFVLKIDRDDSRNRFVISGDLVNGEQHMDLSAPEMLLAGGLLFTQTHAARFDANNAFGWILLLRQQKKIEVPLEAGEELLAQMLSLPQVPKRRCRRSFSMSR